MILLVIIHHVSDWYARYQAGIKLSGIIYMHRISDFRVGGTSRRNFRMFRKLCGDETLKNVTIVTNMWSEVTLERGAARERELATDDVLFKPVLDEGATMERHDGSLTSAQEIVRRIINNTPMTLRVQREIVDEKKDIKETAAGIELDRELAALRAQHKKELAEVREEMEEALAANDLKAKKELEQVRANLEGNIARIEGDRERLSREFAEEKARADATIKEIRGELAKETSERKKREEEMGKLRGDMKTFQENATREQEQLRAQLRTATRRRRTGWGEAIGGLTGLILGGLPGGHIVGGIGRAIDSAAGPRE